MQILTVGKIISRIAIVIASVELLIMLLLGDIPHTMDGKRLLFSNIAYVSLLNAILLVLFASPLIYFWIVKPFVDERDAAIHEVTLLAHYDPLTHLANRRLINQNLSVLMAHCIRRKIYGALMLIDLDNFKTINDTHGHDAGDTILVATAKRLTDAMREEDVVGRIGGDEFVILIHHLDANEQHAKNNVLTIAEKLHTIINEPLEYNSAILQVGASIGISLSGPERESIDTVFKKADIAMYQAKKNHIKYIIHSGMS